MDSTPKPTPGDNPEPPRGESPEISEPIDPLYGTMPGETIPPEDYPQQSGAGQTTSIPPPGYSPQTVPSAGYPQQSGTGHSTQPIGQGGPDYTAYPQGVPGQQVQAGQPGYQGQPGYPGQPGQPGHPPPGYQYPPTYQTPPAKRGGMPVWAWVVIGLAALLLLCVIGAAMLGALAVNTAGQLAGEAGDSFVVSGSAFAFDVSMQAEDYEDAHQFLGADLANQYSPGDLQTRWEALKDGGSITSEVSEPVISGDRAEVTWSLTPNDGTTHTVRLTFERSGDAWKITRADPTLIPSP